MKRVYLTGKSAAPFSRKRRHFAFLARNTSGAGTGNMAPAALKNYHILVKVAQLPLHF